MEKIVKDDDDIFAALNDDENTASIGIEPKSLKAKLKEYNLLEGNSQIHRNLARLAQARLVHQVGSEFYLSELGKFVAEQILKIRQSEAKIDE